MPVYTTDYAKDYAKYRIQIKGLSTKGLIVASLLVIGCTAPLIAQEDITQEDNEQEMAEFDQDQDLDLDSNDSGDQNSEQEVHENKEQESEGREAGLTTVSGAEKQAGQQGPHPTTKPTLPTSEPAAQPEAASAAAKSAAPEKSEGGAATKTLDKTHEETEQDKQHAQAQHNAEQNKAEQPVPPHNAAQEMPALVLEEAAPTASPPAGEAKSPAQPISGAPSGSLAGNKETARPAELKNGQQLPALVSKNGVEQKQVSPIATKPAAKPERHAPVKERTEHITPESEELVGIDTVSLDDPQGNWLFKRIWWERAEKKIEKIRRLVNAVFESRVIFLAQRTDIDRNVLDPFFISIGVGQGELKRILDELIARLEKEREKEGTLRTQERDILQELRKEESALKQMKTDVENVARIDHDIDEALNTLFEQINKVREYEADAWDNFKEIARVLNDIKARELYYTMDIIAKNIEDIQAYIQQDYTRHFNQLSTTAKQQIDRLKKSIETMREKGLDLGKKLELLEQEEKMRASGKQPAEQEEEEEEPEEQGFFGRYIMTPLSYIGSGLKSLWDGVVSVVTWPINYITGGSAGDSGQEVKEEDED